MNIDVVKRVERDTNDAPMKPEEIEGVIQMARDVLERNSQGMVMVLRTVDKGEKGLTEGRIYGHKFSRTKAVLALMKALEVDPVDILMSALEKTND